MAAGKCRDLPPATAWSGVTASMLLWVMLFFPSDDIGAEMARRVWADRPVRDLWLEYAIDHHIEHGVCGGASERPPDRWPSSEGAHRPPHLHRWPQG
jgi:WhiB family redox-sensing transcriptional regulator